jgi:Fe-S-cluster-containing hydrogenase component 2
MSEKGSKVLIFDASRCTGCHYCEMACSYFHLKEVDLSKSNIRVLQIADSPDRDVSHCLHCDNALCLAACPTGAIYRDEETRIVRINPMKCIGCKSCVAACPVGAVWFHEPEGCARKCDLCDGDPKCAKYCSPGALRVVGRKDYHREVEKQGAVSHE